MCIYKQLLLRYVGNKLNILTLKYAHIISNDHLLLNILFEEK
jgi:hypothetical protein